MPVSRRKFIKMTAGVGAGLLLPCDWLPGRKPLYAASAGRRHLINLVCYGGWDSSWVHNAFSEQSISALPGAYVSTSRTGFEHAHASSPYRYTQKCSDSASEARQMPMHPDGRTRLGPLMPIVFEDLQAEMGDMLIWRGLSPAASHRFGNNLILQGNSSSYAISYSGLVSEALAQSSRRPLHYVMAAGTPAELFTNTSMAVRDQVPICIPSREEFRQLTSTDPADLQDSRLRELLARTVNRLSIEGLREKVREPASRDAASSYGNSFQSATSLYGADLLNDPEFRYLYKFYHLAIFRAFQRAAADPNVASQAATQSWGYGTTYRDLLNDIGSLASRLDALPPLDLYLLKPADHAANVGQVGDAAFARIASPAPYTSTFFAKIPGHAFNYALADFLVRRNLSAVVDVPGWNGLMDAHGGYLNELLSLLMTFWCYRGLIKSLKSVRIEDGGSLFDSTLVALHTEFDRYPYHEARDFNDTPLHAGTNHAPTASLLLAGYGIRRGTVVGDLCRGPAVHGEFKRDYLSPLPIDTATGRVDPNGVVVSTLAVFPTIMAIFGARIPMQQTTDWSAVEAIVDPARA